MHLLGAIKLYRIIMNLANLQNDLGDQGIPGWNADSNRII